VVRQKSFTLLHWHLFVYEADQATDDDDDDDCCTYADLFEDSDDGERGREDDERADDWDVELLQRQSDRTNMNLGAVVRVLRSEEHAVGDHGQEKKRDAARDALDAREWTPRRTRKHRHPQMVVGHLLAHGSVEQLLELGQVTGAGDWQNTFYHTIVFLHRHPAITDEEKPVISATLLKLFTCSQFRYSSETSATTVKRNNFKSVLFYLALSYINISGTSLTAFKVTAKSASDNRSSNIIILSYFSPVCRSVICIWSRNQPFDLPFPELSCQIRRNVSGPRQPSVLSMKFMILPVISSCTAKYAYNPGGDAWIKVRSHWERVNARQSAQRAPNAGTISIELVMYPLF